MSAKKKNLPGYGPKRQHLRFSPSGGGVAFVDLDPDSAEFTATISGLVVNQSYQGAALIALIKDTLPEGCMCRVKVGRLAPLLAKIVWQKHIEPGVLKFGVTFLQ